METPWCNMVQRIPLTSSDCTEVDTLLVIRLPLDHVVVIVVRSVPCCSYITQELLLKNSCVAVTVALPPPITPIRPLTECKQV